MASFGLEQQEEASQPTSEASQLASRLGNALRAKRKVKRRVDITKWAKDFESLIKEYGHPQVDQVLSWYIENIGKEYVPEAYSAKTFKDKYLAILKAGTLAPVNVEVSPLAQEIAEHLALKAWPAGAEMQLPSLVQRSLDNYIIFLKQIEALKNKKGIPQHTSAFIRYLQDAKLHSPVNFVTIWYESVLERLRGWTSWHGNLEPWLFSIEHGTFNNQMSNASADYCGSSIRWTQLKGELKNAG